jgi:hypothetical protein
MTASGSAFALVGRMFAEPAEPLDFAEPFELDRLRQCNLHLPETTFASEREELTALRASLEHELAEVRALTEKDWPLSYAVEPVAELFWRRPLAEQKRQADEDAKEEKARKKREADEERLAYLRQKHDHKRDEEQARKKRESAAHTLDFSERFELYRLRQCNLHLPETTFASEREELTALRTSLEQELAEVRALTEKDWPLSYAIEPVAELFWRRPLAEQKRQVDEDAKEETARKKREADEERLVYLRQKRDHEERLAYRRQQATTVPRWSSAQRPACAPTLRQGVVGIRFSSPCSRERHTVTFLRVLGERPAPSPTVEPRQLDGEDAPLVRQIPHAERAAHGLDAPAADGEPETQAGPVDAPLLEGVKEILDLARREAAALVLDLDEDAIGGRARPQRDVAVGAAELERVLEQVGDRGREDLWVDVDIDPGRDGGDGQPEAAGAGFQYGLDLHLADDLGQRDAPVLSEPGLEAYVHERVVEDIAHRPQVADEHGAGAPGDAHRPLLEDGEREHRGGEPVAQLVREDPQERSVPLSYMTDASRRRSYSVTEWAMASSRQRLKVWNSSAVIGASISPASPVMTWQTSP